LKDFFLPIFLSVGFLSKVNLEAVFLADNIPVFASCFSPLVVLGRIFNEDLAVEPL